VFGRLLRFGIVGGLATGVQYLILILLVREAGVWPTAASAAGFVLSSVANYLLNYYFTFRSRRAHGAAFVRFLALAATGLVLNSVLMHVLVGAGWHYLIAQLCATAVVFAWNFAGNSLWTFGSEPAGARS
jgi:putative flippase GtrA